MKNFFCVLFLVLTISSCNLEVTLPGSNSSSDNSSQQNPSDGSNSNTDSSESSPDASKKFILQEPSFTTRTINSKDEVTFDDFFDLGNRIDVKVYMSSLEMDKLSDDSNTFINTGGNKSQIYHRANKVTISLKNGENVFTWDFDNVGIRQKGNTSRKTIYDGNGNLNNNHFKLSFDETFTDTQMYSPSYIEQYGNQEYDEREFLNTLSGLDFKWNKNEDITNIKEIYSSYLYHAGGIMTSHIGLANFSIVEVDKNNREKDFGLCTVFEPSSKSMIKRAMQSEDKVYVNLPTWDQEKKGTYGAPEEKYGDYYECGWGHGAGSASNGADLTTSSINGSQIGIGDISGSYVPAYERKSNTSVIGYNDDLLRNLVSVIDSSSSNYQAINEIIDLEEFAIKEGIEYYLGNPDGMRFNANNYKIYFRRTDGKAMFVPIDTDRCFGIIKDWEVKEGLKATSPWEATDSQGNAYRNKIFSKTILANTTNAAKQKYIEVIDQIRKSSWVLDSTFENFFEKAKTTYSERSFSLKDNNYSFSDYINKKNETVDKYLITNSSGNDSLNTPIEQKRIYFNNSIGWDKVYCYAYSSSNSNINNGAFPGVEMTKLNGSEYYYDLNTNHNMIIFSDGVGQEYRQTEKFDISNIKDTVIFKVTNDLTDKLRYIVSYQIYTA